MALVDSGAIEGDIDHLRSLDLEGLRREWRQLYHREPPRLSRDLFFLGLGLRTSGNRAGRAKQGDPAEAPDHGQGLADDGPSYPDAKP
jgi:hypothetical protein